MICSCNWTINSVPYLSMHILHHHYRSIMLMLLMMLYVSSAHQHYYPHYIDAVNCPVVIMHMNTVSVAYVCMILMYHVGPVLLLSFLAYIDGMRK